MSKTVKTPREALPSEGRHALVTGGNGFIGAHLVEALLARGDEVTVIDVAESSSDPRVNYIRADISSASEVRDTCKGVDVVFHNASLVHTRKNQQKRIWGVNLDGTKHVLEEARRAGVPRFVYVSSASVVYDGVDIENGDETLPYPVNEQAPYAASKIAAEQYVLAADDDKLHTCAIRPHVVFGPGDNRLLPTILERARAGKLKTGVGRGTWLSDFTWIGNLVDALLLAEAHTGPDGVANGKAYFVTNGEPMRFFDFVNQVLDGLNLPQVQRFAPFWIAYAAAAVKESIDTLKGGDLNADQGVSRFAIRYMCTHHYFSIERARSELGYVPRTTTKEGIRATVAALIGQSSTSEETRG